ncbi:MAG: 16S rRNA processing protein RimM [Eubacteriales bacterium]|nr:16S rRNA processing protein RimM [Eubacteriales bacterium]
MLVAIGRILKPRGLQGELKIEITYNRPAVFNDLKSVDLGGKTYTVTRGSVQNGFAYLRLVGVDTIEKAEQLRNQIVKVDASALHLAENEVLSSDLIGFEVIHNGKKIGTVASIENYGAGDFFEIAVDGQGFVLLPNEDDFIAETNMTTRTLILTPNALEAELL